MITNFSLWKNILAFSKPHISLVIFLIVVLICEVIFSQVRFNLTDDTQLFDQYLSQNTYQNFDKVYEFLEGDLYIILDDLVGWQNKPNFTFKSIEYDQFGSRSYGNKAELSLANKNLIFLGDSRVNGGQWVSNDETINAYIEKDKIDALNFASFDYCLDQSYLLMQDYYKQFNPDVFVIGIDSNPGKMLDTHFLPFYDLSLLPRLKPKINYNETIEVMIPKYKELLKNFPDNPELISYLRQHDERYNQFTEFKNNIILKQTPFLKLFSILKNYIKSKEKVTVPKIENKNEVDLLLNAFEQFAEENETELIFILFAARNEIEKKVQPYNEVISLLREKSITYIDTRLLFQQYPGDILELYADEIHLTPAGNRLVANVLEIILNKKN